MRILVTGGTGSLGTVLVTRWKEEHELTILSRNPHNQATLKRIAPDVAFVLSDICDAGEVRWACEGQDVLIHTAALKQVDVGEYHPSEFFRVNTLGSKVVSEAWAETHPPIPVFGLLENQPAISRRMALLISSDKAVSSLNSYGSSKHLATAVFRRKGFSVIRYGNVVNSHGAFLEVWKKQIQEGKPIMVRMPEPTRFFLTLNDAVDLVEDALKQMTGMPGDGAIFVPYGLRAFSILEVAQYISKEYNCDIEYESLLPYEKAHEILIANGEGAIPISSLLAMVTPKWESEAYTSGQYASDKVERMKPEEVLEEVNWTL